MKKNVTGRLDEIAREIDVLMKERSNINPRVSLVDQFSSFELRRFRKVEIKLNRLTAERDTLQ
jgi:hypothetical protein